MHILLTLILLTSTPISLTRATALNDLTTLTNTINTISSDIARSITIPPIPANASVPAFTRPVGLPYNTSNAVLNIVAAINGSMMAYQSNFTRWQNATSNSDIDTAYFTYITALPTLSQSLVARGRSWHAELNLPVYQAMQNLSQIVYAYSQGLNAEGVLSTESTIRTITASGTVTDGTSSWSGPGFLPGS